MRISIKTQAERSVVKIEGDFLGEPEQQQFRNRIRDVIDHGTRKLIIDLSRTRHMNSCGLGSLVAALAAIRRTKGNLSLVNPGDEVRQLFKITKLASVFPIYPSVSKALAIKGKTRK